jgi:hypothetical protein
MVTDPEPDIVKCNFLKCIFGWLFVIPEDWVVQVGNDTLTCSNFRDLGWLIENFFTYINTAQN